MTENYQRISRISVTALVLVFLGIFIVALVDYYVKPPSPGLSRGIHLADIDPERTSSSDRRVAVIPDPGGASATVAAIDGSEIQVLCVDEQGTVTDRRTLAADAGDSTHLQGFWNDAGRLVLYYAGDNLERLEFDPRTGDFTEKLITRGVEGFEGGRGRLAVLKRDGLHLWSESTGELTGPVLDGDILRIEADDLDSITTVAALVRKPGEVHEVHLLDFDDGLTISGELTVLRGNRNDQLRKLRDIRAGNGSISMMFLFRDNRFGFNYLNILRFDRITGEEILALDVGVPIVNSRYNLAGNGPDSEIFTMRYGTLYGENLAECRLAEGREPEIIPLSKSRDMSLEAGRVEIRGHEVLVFTDYSRDGARIFMASTHPEAVKRTGSPREADWGMILGTTAAHFLIALFASWIYLLIAVPPPAVVIAVVQRFIHAELRSYYLVTALGAVGYTAMKFFVTGYFLKTTDISRLFIPGLGTGAGLYVVLAGLSIASYAITAFSFRPACERRDSILETFIRFCITDGIIYSAMFLVYGITAMLLVKM